MHELHQAIQAVLQEWPVATIRIQGRHPSHTAEYAHEVKLVEVTKPYTPPDVQVQRWVQASQTAGRWLNHWYQKHPTILRKIAPLLPTIVRVLQEADLDEIERLFREAETRR